MCLKHRGLPEILRSSFDSAIRSRMGKKHRTYTQLHELSIVGAVESSAAHEQSRYSASAQYYSNRSAVIGSTRVARRAGIQMAMSATALRSNGVTTKAVGSQAFTPN